MAVATIADVAVRAGVGIGTVSRVLNDSPQVSDGTRARVLEAIRDLDYRPSNLARGLSRGTTNTIGLVVPWFTEPSFVERLRGVAQVVNESELDIVVYSVESKAQRNERLAAMPRPDMAAAYLIFSMSLGDHERHRFRDSSAPIAHVDGYSDEVKSYHVDNERGGYLAGCHLLELGHTRIAFVGDPDDAPYEYSPATDRLAGFRRALTPRGIEPGFVQVRNGPDGRGDARARVADLFESADPPTAVFASSDMQALGVLEAARDRGIAVPDDLSVIGFDNIDLASYIGLTTVDQALYESGRLAAQWVLDALCAPDEIDRRGVELPVTVVQRATTGPAPG